MSTWNVITIETTDGSDIDPLEMRLIEAGLGQVAELENIGDRDEWDYGFAMKDGQTVDVRTQCGMSGWSKYGISMDADLQEFTRQLGPSRRLSWVEEWDDPDVGGQVTVWLNGQPDNTASKTLRYVTDALPDLLADARLILESVTPGQGHIEALRHLTEALS